MFQVRVHGRGGQGVVTTAELLSVAAFTDGAHAQAFPSFGSERTGAPVVAFCRIDDRPIRVREPVMRPDAVIIQDSTLLGQVDVFDGLGPDGYLLVNTSRSLADLGLDEFVRRFRPGHAVTVPATELAMTHLGRPLPGAVLLGGFAATTGRVSMPSVLAAIRERFSGQPAAGNAAAAQAAFELVQARKEPAGAQAD
ncbi:MAG: 2-oxoacid:acceptor oxidoreductase family protein [Kribbellaceae bacterium]